MSSAASQSHDHGDDADSVNARKRARVAKACEFCRKSRRKCNGQQPCAECSKRGIACVYAATSRKRGPKSTRVRELELQVSMLREQLRSSRDCAANFVVPRPDGSAPPMANHSAGAPLNAVLQLHTTMLTAAPIDPTAEEEGILRTYFEYSNRLFPCVPEGEFYRALTSSAYDTADAVALAATTPMADSATISDFMEQNKTAMGFRALFYTVLGAGARLQARPKLAEDYFQVGQTYLSLCFCLPSQPSAAAMTLMATSMRVSGRMDMASCYSALAQRMCETLAVDEHQRLCTLLVYYMCCGRVISMPTRDVPPGVPLSVRFADITGYIFVQLSHNFPDIDSDAKLSELAALVAQADDLQVRYGFLAHIRVADIFRALRALILMHLGRPAEAIPLAKEALQLLQHDKLAPFNLPLMLTLRKIRDMLRAAGVDAGTDTDGLISIADRVFQGMPGATSLEDFQRRAADFSRSRMSTSGLPMSIAPLTAVAASALASMAHAAPAPPAQSNSAAGGGGSTSQGTPAHSQPPSSAPQASRPSGYSSAAFVPPPPISAASHMPPVGGAKRMRAPSLGGETTPGGIPLMAAGAGTPGGSMWAGGQGTGGNDSGSVGSNDFFDALINPSLLSVEGGSTNAFINTSSAPHVSAGTQLPMSSQGGGALHMGGVFGGMQPVSSAPQQLPSSSGSGFSAPPFVGQPMGMSYGSSNGNGFNAQHFVPMSQGGHQQHMGGGCTSTRPSRTTLSSTCHRTQCKAATKGVSLQGTQAVT